MRVAGRIRPPGDKSVTHRALMLAGLSRTKVVLDGALTALDAKSTARVLRQLGVAIGPLRRGEVTVVRGRAWRRPSRTLDCGNSGTTARLILGCLAGHRFEARLSGDASLRRRPMRRVTEPLVQMGATVREEAGDGLPLRIRGAQLKPFRFLSPVASAQLKSALLLAGLAGGVPVTVVEPARSRDHTERLFSYLGMDIRVDAVEISLQSAGSVWPRTEPFDLQIPGDASSAAFLVAAAILADSGELLIEDVGVNPTRSGYLDVLERMGGRIKTERRREVCGEPVADLVVSPSWLTGTEVKAAEIPGLIDEVPVLAGLAARAAGETVFRSVGELRVKESNRLNLVAENLRAIGAEAAVAGDDLHVVGSERPLRGRVETARDHRLAMTFAVLGLTDKARIELSEPASAAVSYPGFFEDLRLVTGR
ncbi:MAG: 3-phosphoshikimate 1-carboxyvinyltransferase [Gemmatimonadota bacterium]|nr:MAG: 3-phosphoshikimate 1-carboxyvinyltransferase [Gemmatimonadota bacterium]